MFEKLKNECYRLMYLGINDTVPDDIAKRVVVQNYLSLLSILLMSPFPVILLILDMPEGLIPCFFGFIPILVPFVLNYYHFFFAAKVTGITTGILTFVMGVVFFGFDTGFTYGVMAILVLPILYFRSISHRFIVYLLLLAELSVVWIIFRERIPIYYSPEGKVWLHGFLFFFCLILISTYFLSFDWISKTYEEKNRQLVLQLTQRNEELKNFSYSTSHDLKQPLRTILNFVNLFKLKKGERLDDEGLTYLNFIEEASSRLDHLIDALLKHSVLGQSEKPETFDCNVLIKEVLIDLDTMIKENNAQFSISSLPLITANRTEIAAVFQNLISNAIKFKKAGQPPFITIKALENNEFWQFKVQDNGIGIPEKLQEKIFQIFQKGHTNKDIEGSGIGLANCRKIIKLHAGDLWVESKANAGSTFFFTLKK